MPMAFSIAGEIERDLISKRTKEALRARKASGVRRGRPKGSGKSKLDEFRKELVALLRNGSTKAFVADRYGTSKVNLYNWLKKNNLDVTSQKACVKNKRTLANICIHMQTITVSPLLGISLLY
jgi:DNA invertase Pin-like site-specific DNA recombinase